MTAELARDPSSLVFLELGETLRRVGQLDAASRVLVNGLEQHPELVEGRDLYARVLVDSGEYARAAQVWATVLELDSRHLGAHKGLGFLSFRSGDLDSAMEHLELALAADPTDESVVRALRTVRDAAQEAQAEVAPPSSGEDPLSAGLEGAEQGLLLVDERGRVLGGRLLDASGGEVSEMVAAYLAGAAQEADRTARMLGLGEWRWIVAEGPDGNVYVTPPTPDTLLLILRDQSVPSGRLAMLAERAGAVARAWLEGQQL
jgi:predicted regulator of Ras-like GTPase activity (Roadblock/LC7/MglB family)